MGIIAPPGIFIPPTSEETKELREITLKALCLAAEYAAFTMHLLSPRNVAELRDLAQTIRNITEPHVRTRIPQDGIVRVERQTDDFPRVHDVMAADLSYALWVLSACTQNQEKRAELLGESNRLNNEVAEHVNVQSTAEPFMVGKLMLRHASKFFLSAAWSRDSACRDEYIEESIRSYEFVRDAMDTNYAIESEVMKQRMKMAKELDDLNPGTMNCQDLVSNEHKSLVPEALFGLARCHALAGRTEEALKVLDDLKVCNILPHYMPSPAVIESAELLEALLVEKQGKLETILEENPVVADTAPSVLQHALRTPMKFGGVSPRIVVP